MSTDPPPLQPPPADAPKERWRAWARALRRERVDAETGRRVAQALAAWDRYRRAHSVLLYLAFGAEIDLAPLLDDRGKRVLVPRSHDDPEPTLAVHELAGATLRRHPFGPLEPAASSPAVDASELELVVVPGLCFDRDGYRLGYGRGYFDRFLATLAPGVPCVGVTLDALVVPRLPREPHDVPVTHLVTESGVRPIRAPRRSRAAPPST